MGNMQRVSYGASKGQHFVIICRLGVSTGELFNFFGTFGCSAVGVYCFVSAHIYSDFFQSHAAQTWMWYKQKAATLAGHSWVVGSEQVLL